jgi:transcriptional regulator GlxA family with amidase domain
VIFALLPDTVLLDVAGPAEAFRAANRHAPGSYALSFVGATRAITSSIGLAVIAIEALPPCVPESAIVVLAGVAGELDPQAPSSRALIRWLRTAIADSSVTLMCVCSGAVTAAYAGLLRGRECTTHYACIEELKAAEPDCLVHENRIFVEDGRVLTSAGITAGIDLALHLIGQHLGHRLAAAAARHLVVYMRRSGSDPALSPWVMYRNHLHPAVHRVQDAVTREPAADWSSTRLAEIACTSPRNLARLFAHHAQCSPLDYVQRMRVALARELLVQSVMPLERVAERSGFSSAHQLRRVWRRWETRPPGSLTRPSEFSP